MEKIAGAILATTLAGSCLVGGSLAGSEIVKANDKEIIEQSKSEGYELGYSKGITINQGYSQEEVDEMISVAIEENKVSFVDGLFDSNGDLVVSFDGLVALGVFTLTEESFTSGGVVYSSLRVRTNTSLDLSFLIGSLHLPTMSEEGCRIYYDSLDGLTGVSEIVYNANSDSRSRAFNVPTSDLSNLEKLVFKCPISFTNDSNSVDLESVEIIVIDCNMEYGVGRDGFSHFPNLKYVFVGKDVSLSFSSDLSKLGSSSATYYFESDDVDVSSNGNNELKFGYSYDEFIAEIESLSE